MDVKELDERLRDTIFTFDKEIRFYLDTFDQSHDDKNLTKDDLEDLGRQVLYTLGEFRECIIDYLKDKKVRES